jgi:hypothetical protein
VGRETAEAAPGSLADQRGGGKSPGWVARLGPDGKRFAFVLTHDVEGPEGLKKVQSLAELELSLGFRSSFNLVPENNSCVPDEIRHWLTVHGFEVGVHALHHDGSLFASRKAFRREAPKTNQYLKKWNAVGFRSGFMLHNLDWTHDLNVLYDASTFDTDPFEPQPDGVNTIFPFWVPNPQCSRLDVGSSAFDVPSNPTHLQRVSRDPSTTNSQPAAPRRGYIELPCTLVQDFSLFIILQERSIDIWKRKLDWIASRGGMALLDVHPDYACFGGNSPGPDEYPVASYEEFLEWLKQEYEGRYWHALPREVAAFYKQAVFRV